MTPKKLAPDSLVARIIIGTIPTAAILYSWVTPMIVSALEQSPSISAEAAGYVFSANMYGTAIGGCIAIAVARTLPWRVSCAVLLLGIASLDVVSIEVQDPTLLAVVRFGHGLMGGVLMGFGAVLVTRTVRPERTISISLGLQTLLGGAMLVGLAPLIDTLGAYPIWVCLVGVAAIALLGLPFLSDYPNPVAADRVREIGLSQAPLGISLLIILALFSYQAAQNAPFIYLFELGQSYALSDSFMGWAGGIAIWAGGVAALFTAYWSTRSGYVVPLVVGGSLSASSVALFSYPSAATYFVANVGFAFFFTITLVYLLTLFSVLDETGRFATVGNFVNTLGLASGPFLAATLLTLGYSYVDLVWFGAAGMILASSIAVLAARYVESYERRPG